jgi:hypothetical protein
MPRMRRAEPHEERRWVQQLIDQRAEHVRL